MYCINLFTKIPTALDINRQQLSKRKRIIYFGRIDSTTKNVPLIKQIDNQINLIDFYGNGNKKIIKELGKNYKGYLNPKINPSDLIKKYKFMVLMSNYEGFSFSLVESLACGVPIIVKNCFLAASYLVNNNENGFLIKNGQGVTEYAKQIN
ncbi:glycosyltransferase [bacterium]|nr:glycosyltransferase [bacterium]